MCKKKRVLIVDDEHMLLDSLSFHLEGHGYVVDTCSDGEKAINHYRSYWPDIDMVLLDMRMPIKGGKDTFLEMKRHNPAVKALLMSGYSEDEDVRTALKQGALGFMEKPFSIEDVRQGIASALQNS